MHQSNLGFYRHSHIFYEVKDSNMRKVLLVVIITLFTMVSEIVFGSIFNSMALLADGWHMATHASALGITFFTFLLMKKLKQDSAFSFGTWKIEILGAYTSAILLAIVGFGVVYSSVERLLHPAVIQYDQALIVTFIGLGVNVLCAFILNSGKHPETDHHHPHEHSHEHGLGIKSASLHVIADAMTSVFAILALLSAKLLKLNFLDPAMGIVSTVLIFKWSIDLLRETSNILVDRTTDNEISEEIKAIIEDDGDTKISDLHIWKVGEEKYACIISLVARKPKKPEFYKNLLTPVNELAHISIEVVKCEDRDTEKKG